MDGSSRFDVSKVPAGAVLVLAPHPDDFDAVAVTLCSLRDDGRRIILVVTTSGESGVEDDYAAGFPDIGKSAIREAEQVASFAFFGTSAEDLSFARLEEDEEGAPLESAANLAEITDILRNSRPTAVFLPHWNDTNAGHRRISAMFAEAVAKLRLNCVAYFHRDPKTITMRYDVYTPYVKDTAEWKARFLRFHDSQHQRNLNTRGHGFDERILTVDRDTAEVLCLNVPYAEVFEIRASTPLYENSKLFD